MIPTALCLLLLGLGLLLLSQSRRAALGMPSGRVVYWDKETLGEPPEPLYDPHNHLVGRPDYLVESDEGVIPVEVKSGSAPARPYRAHTLQLAAYCMLVHASRRSRPPYGILKYQDKAIAVDYTPSLERELLDVLAQMRRTEGRAPARSHQLPQRCRSCSFRQVCDQVLK